jgi:hypothetical protein
MERKSYTLMFRSTRFVGESARMPCHPDAEPSPLLFLMNMCRPFERPSPDEEGIVLDSPEAIAEWIAGKQTHIS